jgi:predicted DNA-binding transcriptional regulator YafY
MDTLQMSGVPVEGERGVGYMATGAITLPPLSLSAEELEALNLGIAIVAEAADPDLARAAMRLGDKLDAVLPTQVISDADSWKFAVYPFADAARGLGHMPTVRAAIKARQKLRLQYQSIDGSRSERTIRPLHMEYWGRVWTLTAWCEMRAAFRVFRIDLIESAQALPELFEDEPGKRMSDYMAEQSPT